MKRDYDRWEILFVGVVFTAGLALRLHLALLNYCSALMLSWGHPNKPLTPAYLAAVCPLPGPSTWWNT
jgi:hypothetical protein